MQNVSGRISLLFGATLIAAAFLMFCRAMPARAAAPDPDYNYISGPGAQGSITIDQPQSFFNLGDLPATAGSLFPHGQSSGNQLEVTGGTVAGNVYGGIDSIPNNPANASPASESSQNKVTIGTGSAVTIGSASRGGNVTGGWSFEGSAKGNEVTVTGSEVYALVIGGWVRGGRQGGSAEGNTVTINSGTLHNNIYGAYSQGSNGEIKNNNVVINGGVIRKSQNSSYDPHIIAGGYSSVGSNRLVQGNTVEITGGEIDDFRIYGGRGQTNSTRIIGNTVVINENSQTTRITKSDIYGGQSISGTVLVDENTVNIGGGTVEATIYGGYSGGNGTVGSVDGGNSVKVTGGAITGNIFGGYSEGGTATYNSVAIGGSSTTLDSANLYGGFVNSRGGDAFTGNTLTFTKLVDVNVNAAGNFEYVNFGIGGQANIGSLNTTATGVSNPGARGVSIDTAAFDVTFNGNIAGEGWLAKQGAGALILTGDNRIFNSAGVAVQAGELRIGDGGDKGSLYTSGYAVASGATLSYDRNDKATYLGIISGDGVLRQMGGDADTGTLVLTGDSNSIGDIEITGGTLQLGDGGATGSIEVDGGVNIAEDAALAYNHSDYVEDANHITGEGKVVQRGGGTLRLNDESSPANQSGRTNSFTGGTEIESGILEIADLSSYNTATATTAPADAAKYQTSAGYITFTGQDPKLAVLVNDVMLNNPNLQNSFRTAEGAGQENYVDLTAFASVTMSGITLNGNAADGGAFYVAGLNAADATTMTVLASNLRLGESSLNKARGGEENDLFVEEFGTFNLFTSEMAVFNSGIDGDGELNLAPLSGASDANSYAEVYLVNNNPDAQTFKMGTTNVTGDADKALILYMARGNISEGDHRVVFVNEDSFSLGARSMLAGDGIVTISSTPGGPITPGGSITVTDGAVVLPYAVSAYQESEDPGTLRFVADEITLNNFAMGYAINGNQDALDRTQSGLGLDVVNPNSSLLDLRSPNKIAIDNGQVFIIRTAGLHLAEDDYLIMRSQNGFVTTGANGAAEDLGDGNVNDHLTAFVDGFEVNPDNGVLRGRLAFMMGGDPGAQGAHTAIDSGVAENIWFGTALNSLSLDWTGSGVVWTNGDLFDSEQTGNDNGRQVQAHSFMPGDKVYISGEQNVAINLPAPSSAPDDLSGINITVSGLVVGKNTDGVVAESASYIIAGDGGIKADLDSAFGQYVDEDLLNVEDSVGETILKPTGMLQKYGGSALTFENSGANMFMQGIDLNGGTTRFRGGNQLYDGSYDLTDGTIDDSLHGTRFTGNAILEATGDVTLHNSVTIAANVTGTFSAAANTQFTFTGLLEAEDPVSSVFNKAGAGTVRLDDATGATLVAGGPFEGLMTINDGTLDVAGDYGAARFDVYGDKGAGILSGTGILGHGTIQAGGTLKPDGLTWSPGSGEAPTEDALTITDGNLAFGAGGRFAVRLAEYYDNGNRYSDKVIVDENGSSVTISPAATLAVEVDYYKLNLSDEAFYTVIDASATNTSQSGKFALDPATTLPRGVTMEHGWGLDETNMDLYQIGEFRYNPADGFGKIPDLTHNQNEVGDNLDWIIQNQDPGLGDIIERLSDPDLSDKQVREQLDQLTGDMTANALYLAFKEPWRHPFNRLDYALSLNRSGDFGLYRPRAWSEVSSRYQKVEHDGNAHGFTVRRAGIAFGVDTMIAPRTIIGAAFRYTRPHLEQSNGDVYADDYEAGLYGMTGLPGGLDMKMYVGYSRQEYEFDRNVTLAPTPSGSHGRLRERLSGETSGDAVAVSLELTRPFKTRDNFQIAPIAALDYEKAWLNNYEESKGQASLEYDDASMERLRLRAGLKGEYNWNEKLDLKAWAQYAAQVGGRDYPKVGVRFAGVTSPGQPTADIHGVRAGRNYANFGFGADWKLDDRKDKVIYMNYDVKLNSRMTDHIGEIGFMMTW